jgi:hypothetical protein
MATLEFKLSAFWDRVEIRIRDNGIGIPSEVKEKMFKFEKTSTPPVRHCPQKSALYCRASISTRAALCSTVLSGQTIPLVIRTCLDYTKQL